jgi:hypothetical protein
MSKESSGITRRDFLRGTATAALAAAVSIPLGACRAVAEEAPAAAGEAAKGKTAKVVLVRDAGAVRDDGTFDETVLGDMLDRAVCALTETQAPAAAWGKLVKADDVVGIKTNGWQLLPTPKAVEAVLQARIVAAGVAAERVKITDRDARTMLADCTALFNAAPLRSHHWSGTGGCIKNYIMFSDNPAQYHPDACDSLAQAWELPVCKGKTRLNILVALTPQSYGRGPQSFDARYVWAYKGLIVGFDPVAVDSVGAQLLKAKRLAVFGEEQPLTPSTHIASAETKYGLGVADPKRIEIIRIGLAADSLV